MFLNSSSTAKGLFLSSTIFLHWFQVRHVVCCCMNLDVSCVLCSLFYNQETQHGIKGNANFPFHLHVCCRFSSFSGPLSRLQFNHIAMFVSWADFSRCSSWSCINSFTFTISSGWLEWFVIFFLTILNWRPPSSFIWWLCKRSRFDAWLLIWPWKVSHFYRTW